MLVTQPGRQLLFFSFFSSFCPLLQKIMNRLIKRYILKAQRDKDNDEVNEGEFSGSFHVWITEFLQDLV